VRLGVFGSHKSWQDTNLKFDKVPHRTNASASNPFRPAGSALKLTILERALGA
jgi:hypothetical protein